MLEMSHNHLLIGASLAVALMSGFTGLSLLKGASNISVEKRKFNIALASIAMGGGIWSMHFVAMLGLQLPIVFFYEILTTLASALIAILVVGMALLILHFIERDKTTMIAAGILVGFGIVIMHYLGMSGMRGAVPQYTIHGVIFTIILAVGAGVITFLVAYGQRKPVNILMGTLLFGAAVFAVHFVAMYGTVFQKVSDEISSKILISNEVLAIGVSMTAFIICGAFLLTGITFISPSGAINLPTAADDKTISDANYDTAVPDKVLNERTSPQNAEHSSIRIPYEKEGKSQFVSSNIVYAIRAEGHYTYIYTSQEKLFCTWPISEITKRLKNTGFINCHRSYLINPSLISSFERKKDNGICYFESNCALERVPVSRSKLKTVQKALGLA